MRHENTARQSRDMGGFSIPAFLDIESVRAAASMQDDLRTSAALGAIVKIMEGARPEEAAKATGARTGTIQIVLARLAAEGTAGLAARRGQSSRELTARELGYDADGLERVSSLFLDRAQGERIRWLASFFRGASAALVSDATGVPQEEVLNWVERLQSSGMAAFPDLDGRIHSLPAPADPPKVPKVRRDVPEAEAQPETPEQLAERLAAAAEASARSQRRRERREEALAAMQRPDPGPDEIRERMIGGRTDEDMDFLIQTAMDGEQKRRLQALRLAAATGAVKEAGDAFGFNERMMYWYGGVLARKGPAGLVVAKSALQPYSPRLNRAELEAAEKAVAADRKDAGAVQAILRLVQGDYPPEVARDSGMTMDALQSAVANAGELMAALAVEVELGSGRDVGSELMAAGYTSADFAALISPYRSEDERLRAKALRLLVRGEAISRVSDVLGFDETALIDMADAVLDEGTDALLDDWQERKEPMRRAV